MNASVDSGKSTSDAELRSGKHWGGEGMQLHHQHVPGIIFVECVP